MDCIYIQKTGNLYHGEELVQKNGYSGKGAYKNKPEMQNRVGKGPIPTGEYKISPLFNSSNTGPYALPLTPIGHNAQGRTAFQIHGDSIKNPGTASGGCIIMRRTTREKIWQSEDRTLIVKATESGDSE